MTCLCWVKSRTHLKKPIYCIYFPKTDFCKCFSAHGACMSLALDSSICDHCCFRSEIEKANKQCLGCLHTLWFWIYVYHRVLCLLRATFLSHEGLKKLFFHLCPSAILLTPHEPDFFIQKPPLSSNPWYQG